MDIKFHINKIIKSGGDADDWLDFIGQLKHNRTDRDLLLQIHTVALKNAKKEASVGYKRLMIGLANLQSEVSLDLARETYLDAKALDLDCAIVCVYYAQFEYMHQRKDRARQIIQAAKRDGCVPTHILKQAYQNWRNNKLNLFDGINDPWNALRCDQTDDAVTGGSLVSANGDTTENKLSQLVGSKQACKTIPTSDSKNKMKPPPIRAFNKSKSASNIKSSAWCTPGIQHPSKNVFDKENMGTKPTERHGPSMSPFMKSKYSPLFKRKFDLEMSDDIGIFAGLYSSAEKKYSFVTPIKSLSKSDAFDSGSNASTGSCTSGVFTNILKELNSDQKKHIPKSILSPCIFEGEDKKIDHNRSSFSSHTKDDKLGLHAQKHSSVINQLQNANVNKDINVESDKSRYERHWSNGCALGSNMNSKIDSELVANLKSEILVLNNDVNNKNLTNPFKSSLSTFHKEELSDQMNHLKIDLKERKIESPNEVPGNNVLGCKFENVFAANEKNKTIVEVDGNETVKEFIPEPSTVVHSPVVSNVDQICNVNENLIYTKDVLVDNSKNEISDLKTVGNIYSENCSEKIKVSPTTYTVKGVRYHRKGILGKGGSCKVYEVLSEYGQTFALKKVNLHDVDDFILNLYKNEIKWLEKMKGNQHIIRLHEWEMKDETLFLLLEKGDSDLAHTLKKVKSLSSNDMKSYWKQIITAVKVIHENGIIHTDLKPANFLLVEKMLKLIDFGIANSIQDNRTSVTRECQMGTLNYMSPEALVQDGCRISRACDVWSLGCILYYMIYRKTPYSGIKNQYARFLALQQGKPIDYSGIDDELLLDCLQGCLKHDRKQRYTIQQLLTHPYLN